MNKYEEKRRRDRPPLCSPPPSTEAFLEVSRGTWAAAVCPSLSAPQLSLCSQNSSRGGGGEGCLSEMEVGKGCYKFA